MAIESVGEPDDPSGEEQSLPEDTFDEAAAQATSVEVEGQRSWIFQANPSVFDLAGALQHRKSIRWDVRRYKSEIHKGDTAYLWLSGPKGGLLARGIVAADPAKLPDSPEEAVYSPTPQAEATNALQVDVEIAKIYSQPITRDDCLGHPILRSMSLIQQPQATNFRLTPEEAKALEALAEHGPGSPTQGQEELTLKQPSMISVPIHLSNSGSR